MSKRRRTSSINSKGQEDDSLDSSEASTSTGPTIRKRKKNLDPMYVCHQLYDIIRNHKKDDGSLLCDSFIRVSKRRQEPGYYDVVSNPMDLLKVQQKLKTDEYEDVDDLQSDIELIVNNTKAFYKRSSHEYKDANELLELFLMNKNRLLHVDEEPKKVANNRNSKTPRKSITRADTRNNVSHDNGIKVISDDEENGYEDLFHAVMHARDENNKLLHTHFQLLPAKRKYPEYYEVIEQPVDLKMIALKIENNKYNHLVEMERDLMLMCKNACLFNEPGSQIYKQAKALRKFVQNRRFDMEEGIKPTPVKSPPVKNNENNSNSSRRARKSKGNSVSTTAALKDDESEPEPEEEEVPVGQMDPNNPQWKLFETVRTATGNNNTPLSEPFWKLPSRKFYPDYYREIKNPMSLGQIKRKLLKKGYGNLSEVAGDLTIMFENAKKYNTTSSKLYKDAVKLQKLMQTKVQELLDIDQDGDTENSNKRRSGLKVKQSPVVSTFTPTRGRPPKDSTALKKKLHMIAKYMLDYTTEDGRKPMLAFMEKPSKKLYPDYYEVIAEPIDFLEIESKIKAEQYSCENDLIKDFKLMFSNCRQFNEENSPIYEDANLLEKYLLNKVENLKNSVLPPAPVERLKREKPVVRVATNFRYKQKRLVKLVRPLRPLKSLRSVRRVRSPKPSPKPMTPLEKSLKSMYEVMRDYREPKENRQLSQTFMRLPSKLNYPDYYEVIKHPMGMEKISQKLRANVYDSLDELANDFMLMLDNACKYNEPDSQIYKDAMVLQRFCLQTKLQMKEDENTVPDVAAAVQDIFLNLFTNVYNHQDDDGRCYSDSMADLPEHDEIDGKKVRALSLDLMKRRLDKGMYKRLDIFQEDFFSCMDRARQLSRTTSQIFEDSIELQTYFIQQRDELCRNGELLSSPALNHTFADAKTSIEQLRQSKQLKESLEDETETRSSDDSMIKDVVDSKNISKNGNGEVSDSVTMTCDQRTFKVGEFVYAETKEKGCEPHILHIERLWDNKGQQMCYGNYYLRPAETYHLSTRKFLEKEVFKSDTHVAVPLEEIQERCCVVNVKQYHTMKPEGFDEKDVYVCESRYSTRHRCFKKIKIYPENETINLVPREVPLEPKRVMSVFRERVEKHKDELAELEEQEKMIEKDKPNVVAFTNMGIDDGNTYYEQFNTICSGVVKTGDFVYVVADGGKQIIAQIDCIWETRDEKCYFRGPWFVMPADIPNSTNKLFYKQEVFLSTLEEASPIVSIIGKCSVLEYNDYVTYRPTEIPEADVFICSSLYDEINRQIKKLPPEGLKKCTHSPMVTLDEVYYFTRPINPPKILFRSKAKPATVTSRTSSIIDLESSPQLTKMSDMDVIMEDSLDGGPPSVGSGEIPVIVTATPGGAQTPSLPVSTKKKANKNKVVTGYILYSREVRKQVVQNNPESTFGDISRIVGSEWKSLPSSEKQIWEEKASKLNEETKAMLLLDEQCSSPAAPPPADQIYECLWDNCDYQFEEVPDLIEHCIKDSKESQGHVQAYFQENPGADFTCHWRQCGRIKKNLQPFPNIARLIRHVRDMHINKGNGRVVAPENRSKNFKPSSKPQAVNRPTPSATPNPPPVSTNVVSATVQKVQEPLFISVPPRPQRVLHSEAYIKYIEGLQAESRHISNWEKTLHATQENTRTDTLPDMEKLQQVATWLGNKVDQQDNVVDALWALRNQLLKDSLSLHKTL